MGSQGQIPRLGLRVIPRGGSWGKSWEGCSSLIEISDAFGRMTAFYSGGPAARVCTERCSCLFLPGPDPENKQRVYQISLRGSGQIESRVTLPAQFLPYACAVGLLGEEEFLYVFDAQAQCLRLDLNLNTLETIEKPHGPIRELRGVFSAHACVFMILGETLWILDQTDVDRIWVVLVRVGFPDGEYTLVDDVIYSVHRDRQTVKKFSIMTSQLFDVKSFPWNEFKVATSLVGRGSQSICFTVTEMTEGEPKVQLKEFDLDKGGVRVLGTLPKCPERHTLRVCVG